MSFDHASLEQILRMRFTQMKQLSLLAWDADSAYYLAGAVDPKNKNTGAMSLLMWTAIQFSSGVTNQFNFEGGMVEPIERFFRSFGAKQTPYFEIRKTNSRLLKLL